MGDQKKLVKQKRGKAAADDGAPGGAPTKAGPKSAPPALDRVRLQATTDAGIVLLFDPAHFSSIVDQESWEAALRADEDIAARIAKGHLVPLSTGADGRYAVDVVVGDAPYPKDPEDAKGIIDTSAPYLFVVARTAMLGGLEHVHSVPDAKSASAIELEPGRYAVTVHAMKGKGRADVLAHVRRLANGEAFAGRTKLAVFEPKPTQPLGKLTTLKHCQRAALVGQVADAMPVLARLADEKQETPAAAALAELHAWQDQWPAFVERAITVMTHPRGVIGNTTTELSLLLEVAGHATGLWDRIANALPPTPTMRADVRLRDQIAARGALPPPAPDPTERRRHEPLAVRQAAYDLAMTPDAVKKRDRTPDDTAKSALVYALTYGLDALALEKLAAGEKNLSWNQTLDAASFLVELGQSDDAWSLVERSLHKWRPLSYAQVVPLELLTKARLRPLLTAERRAKILSTPRGGEQ
jgi:hypothetical protein